MAISVAVAVGDIADELVSKLAEKAKALKIGDGSYKGLDMGPLMPDQIITDRQVTGSLPPAPANAPDKTPASEDPLADLLRMMQ